MIKITGTPKEQEFGHYCEKVKAFICKTASQSYYKNDGSTYFGIIDTDDHCVALLFKFGTSTIAAYADLDDYGTLEDWARENEMELVQIFSNDSDFSVNITF